MRVALDAQLALGTSTGIGEYVRGLAPALRALSVDVVALDESALDPWRFDRRVLWDQVLLPYRARASGAQLLHCASGTIPRFVNLPVVVTVHDVAPLRVQSHARTYARFYFGKFSLARYRDARAIAVDSEFSRRELLDVMPGFDPNRVRVVYPGVSRDYATLERERGDGRTILVVGTVERRKNLETVLRALPHLDGARVVSVGPHTPYREECEKLARELGVWNRVEFRGYVPRDNLYRLYETCAVAAVPSTYEGFGYAAAQALCAGVPCVISDRASLPELAGGDATVVPIEDHASWVASLSTALRGDSNARAAAVREAAIRRFSWENSAKAMLATYELALQGEGEP